MHMNRWILAAFVLAMLHLPAAAQGRPLRLNLRDGDGDGRISRNEFLDGNAEHAAALGQVFDRLDADRDGFLAMQELRAPPGGRPRGEPLVRHGPDDEIAAADGDARVEKNASGGSGAGYAVVMSATDATNAGWRAVADELVRKHAADRVVYTGSVTSALPALRDLRPRHTAFVARPEIVGRLYVARIHRMTRRLDDDPYGDTVWGIVSSASPTGALRVAAATGPALVNSAIGITGLDAARYEHLLVLSDGKPGEVTLKTAKGVEKRSEGDADRTELFVRTFADMKPHLIVGSGHATERNLEMPFSKGNTECRNGRWVGLPRGKGELPIAPDDTPRVFLGAGNCLIGNFRRSADTMAPTLIEGYGFNQFVGYTVPTWYGKGGWGTLGLWNYLPGHLSLAEAWFFNNQVIIRELITKHPAVVAQELELAETGNGEPGPEAMRHGREASGMLWDRDVVAFYGDPAVPVRLRPDGGALPAVEIKGGEAVCRGAPPPAGEGPFCFWLEKDRRVAGGTNDVVTDDFAMLFHPAWTNGRLALTPAP